MRPLPLSRRSIVLLVVLLLILVGLYLRPAPLAPESLITLNSPADLQVRFNQDVGQPRLLLLVAPT